MRYNGSCGQVTKVAGPFGTETADMFIGIFTLSVTGTMLKAP
jgi:hypothetical protein